MPHILFIGMVHNYFRLSWEYQEFQSEPQGMRIIWA